MDRFSVSVALITYERRTLLREALRSIEKQTRRPDLVFISDNSKNPDYEVVAEFPELPIQYHFHDRRLAIDEHWIWCVTQPDTDLVAVLEDDNLFRPRHLEVLAGAMERFPETSLGGTITLTFQNLISRFPHAIFDPAWPVDLLTMEPVVMPSELALATYLFGSPFASSAIMFRRSKLPTKGFAQSGSRIGHDRWMWAQLAAQGPVVYCPEPTVLYRDHDVQVVKNFNRAAHRSDARFCTRMIWELLLEQGISPEEALGKLGQRVSESTKRWWSYILFRNRIPEIWTRAISALRPEASLRTAKLQAVEGMIWNRLRSWRK